MLSNVAGQDLTILGRFRHSHYRERAENPRILPIFLLSACSVGLFRGEKVAYLRAFAVYLRAFCVYLRIALFHNPLYIYKYFFKKERVREEIAKMHQNKYARFSHLDSINMRINLAQKRHFRAYLSAFSRTPFVNWIKHLALRKAQFVICAVLHAPTPSKSAQGRWSGNSSLKLFYGGIR